MSKNTTRGLLVASATFENGGFADAVFAIWLGPTPPSADLKTGMLGGA